MGRSLGIEDFLVHLLAKPAEFDRNDGEWVLSRHHADSIGALHPLAVHQLVVFLQEAVGTPASDYRKPTYLNRDYPPLLPIRLLEHEFVSPSPGVQVHDFAPRVSLRCLEVHGDFKTLNEPSESFPILLHLFSREGTGTTLLGLIEDKVLESEPGSEQKLVAHLGQILPVATYRVRLKVNTLERNTHKTPTPVSMFK